MKWFALTFLTQPRYVDNVWQDNVETVKAGDVVNDNFFRRPLPLRESYKRWLIDNRLAIPLSGEYSGLVPKSLAEAWEDALKQEDNAPKSGGKTVKTKGGK